ncbi:hypothetical protein BKA65DRAFT_64981 [Rhexocercosporidium sp. MPI-PUGE-AT-0058]|nr:hypothetical protein BKA65DRAFT_64981 [Rhexocercosporidium sp. MPI-PUGE-AT-0058]
MSSTKTDKLSFMTAESVAKKATTKPNATDNAVLSRDGLCTVQEEEQIQSSRKICSPRYHPSHNINAIRKLKATIIASRYLTAVFKFILLSSYLDNFQFFNAREYQNLNFCSHQGLMSSIFSVPFGWWWSRRRMGTMVKLKSCVGHLLDSWISTKRTAAS